MKKKISPLTADLSLLMVSCIWGLTFVTLKNALAEIMPFSFNFYRFSIAALLMFCLAPRSIVTIKKETMLAGILLGVFLFGGHSLQTIGLQYTTVANAGFLTGLVVVFVPLLLSIQNRKSPPLNAWLGALCAFAGVAVLSLGASLNFNLGDILVILCAVCFALQLIYVGRYCHSHNTVQLVFIQIITVAVLSLPPALTVESLLTPFSFTTNIWIALFVTAVLATTLAFFVQATMQKYTESTHAAIVLSGEPVFAAIFAALLLGEIIDGRVLAGGSLVLAGMLIAELNVFSWPRSHRLFAKRGD